MGLFDPITGGGTDTSALRTGANQAKGFLNQGKHDALQTQGKYEKKYTPQYQTAAAGYDPFLQQGTAANAMYGNALGLNGQAGYDAATGAFHENPGYQFLVDQGEQGVLRNNAAMGGVASGKTLEDLTKFRVGLADQTWQQYLDNLFRGSGQGLQGAAGKSQALQNLGQALQATGNAKSDIQTGAAGALATNASNLGAGLQGQSAADQASQLSLLQSILGAGAKVGGAYFGA